MYVYIIFLKPKNRNKIIDEGFVRRLRALYWDSSREVLEA